MQHIFFTGDKGVGKSTLVRAMLREKKNIGGFRTVKSGGAVYLLRPGETICAENRLFFCGQETDPAPRFDELGGKALSPSCDCIVMDELGPHEENAAAFQTAVFHALDGDTPVIGVLQKADSEFLRRVASHPNVRVMEVTAENRDALRRELTGQLVGSEVRHYAALDSTNDELKRMAAADLATNGLTVMAEEQTAGRGRRGKSFLSAAGKGLYCSVYLTPDCDPAQLPMLTAWAAVAVHDAVEKVCGVHAGIKWPNDLVAGGKKLCGILTELVMAPTVGVVLGIGLNLSQSPDDFGPELAPIAISLAQLTGKTPDRERITEALLQELDMMYACFPRGKEDYLRRYRELCLTWGEVRVLTQNGSRAAVAEGIAEDFSLCVRYADGTKEALQSGEVSVRGIYAFI